MKIRDMKLYTVIQVLLPVVVSLVTSESNIVVEIQQGSIRGTILASERSNRTFFAFMGIPYAKPPVGELRFQAPQTAESWSGIRNATSEGSVCPQIHQFSRIYIGEEDCLFLNVYTPQLPSSLNGSHYPVMVTIHGGAFIYGHGNKDIYGPDYLVDSDVIVVTFNYRLGILGFLSLQNEEVPGNNGLKDQVMALRWVQQNIAQFGGDPNKVTIFGCSAGGASVHYHMLSPLSQGLFQRAISQSGSSLSTWAYSSTSDSLRRAFLVGTALGMNTSDPRILLEHLKTFTPQEFVPVTGPHYSFLPTVDSRARSGEVFLPDSPVNLISAGNFSKIPFITGVTSHEGMIIASRLRHRLDEDVVEVLMSLPYQLERLNNATAFETAVKVKDFYFDNSSTAYEKLVHYIDLTTDNAFVNKAYCSAKKQAEFSTAPVYFYEFSFSGTMSHFKNHIGYEDLPGASHADDTCYLFRVSLMNKTFDSDSPELETSARMVRLWTNFAKTGNPTPEPDPLLQNVTWSPANETNLNYLSINSNLSLQHDFRARSIHFWTELYNNYTTHTLCGW